jgi:hypothetical protein
MVHTKSKKTKICSYTLLFNVNLSYQNKKHINLKTINAISTYYLLKVCQSKVRVISPRIFNKNVIFFFTIHNFRYKNASY